MVTGLAKKKKNNIKNSCQLKQTTEIINQHIFKVDHEVCKKSFKISNPIQKVSGDTKKKMILQERTK